MWLKLRPAFFAPLAVGFLQACSGNQQGSSQSAAATFGGTGSPQTTSSSDVAQSGGAGTDISAGGMMSNGGTSHTGFAPNSGGVFTSTIGGSSGLGGAQTSGGTTAASSKSSGGSSTTGGTRSTGGAPITGGAKSTGGTPVTGGTAASGGTKTNGGTNALAGATSTGGENVCATAAEDASITLKCPQGQIVESVVFASYGTPTGACGSFAIGSCDAASSKTMVESLCLGRSSCTVPATNGAFGDPCRSTTKHLDAEVSCVVGTPSVTPNTPYRGIANSPASQISALGATWCYNWGTTPKSTDCADPYFVPMIWDGSSVASAIKAIGDAGYDTVLAFNEPNKTDQSNMSVADALALWPTITSDPKIRVSSPAVSDDGRSWLVDFMTQAKAKGLRVDFIAMHWYGWNAGSCAASQLEGAVNWASQWGLPVWITEFGCMGSSNTDAQTVIKFFNDSIKMLNNHPLVERYAWYPWNTYNELYLNNAMTDLGKAFAAAPQYRQ